MPSRTTAAAMRLRAAADLCERARQYITTALVAGNPLALDINALVPPGSADILRQAAVRIEGGER